MTLTQHMDKTKGSVFLGTDTVQILREQGFDGMIIGVSGNTPDQVFLDAGCDAWQSVCTRTRTERNALVNLYTHIL